MSDLIGRQAAIDAVTKYAKFLWETYHETCNIAGMIDAIDGVPIASPWHRVEEPPEEAGEYIVAYHPCWWDDVKTQVTKVGIDSFRGKASWAKRKTQRVTHWMEKPEPPKEDA